MTTEYDQRLDEKTRERDSRVDEVLSLLQPKGWTLARRDGMPEGYAGSSYLVMSRSCPQCGDRQEVIIRVSDHPPRGGTFDIWYTGGDIDEDDLACQWCEPL